jgi:hypothetical protein
MIDYSTLDFYKTKDIEKWYLLAKCSIINKTENSILFDGMSYGYDSMECSYYAVKLDAGHSVTVAGIRKAVVISDEEVLRRLDTFMRGYKLKKLMKKI